MTNLGKFIKQRRESLGLSQGFLSKKMALTSPQYISNIERGKCSLSPVYFKVLQNILKIDMQDLILRSVIDYEIWLLKKINKGKK